MNQDEKRRAAIQLKNDPLFNAMLDELQRDAYTEWSTSSPSDKERREVAYHKHTALVQLRVEVENLTAPPFV